MSPRHLLLAVVVVWICSACGPSTGNLEVQAAQDLQCSEDEIELRNTKGYSGYRKTAWGCGRSLFYLYDGSMKKWVSPLERAAFEMNCPKQQMTVFPLDSRTVGVHGCGQRGVYKAVQGAGWVLDSTSSPR